MSTLLALDTATEACSVALLHDGKVTSHYEVIPRLHAQKLLPMIQQLLADAGTTLQAVDAIAFGRGPGAFTGVRIAIGVVQGLAFALDRPVLPVSNLAVWPSGPFASRASARSRRPSMRGWMKCIGAATAKRRGRCDWSGLKRCCRRKWQRCRPTPGANGSARAPVGVMPSASRQPERAGRRHVAPRRRPADPGAVCLGAW